MPCRFRLAACLLDLLWGKDGWEELESALQDLPPELPKVYDLIFKEIKSQGQMGTASVLLQWLLYSERPLSLEELTEVTKVNPQGAFFDAERGAADESYVTLTLSSFITISKELKLVQFAHQTVKEYLLLDTTEEGLFNRKVDSNVFVANCCLSYMQFCNGLNLRCGSPDGAERRLADEFVLLEYVFNNWYRHVSEACKVTAEADSWDEPRLPSKSTTSQERITRWTTLPADYSHSRSEDIADSNNGPQCFFEWAESTKHWIKQIAHTEHISHSERLSVLACEGYERFVSSFTHPDVFKYCDSGLLEAAIVGDYMHMVRLILADSHRVHWLRQKHQTAGLRIPSYKSQEAIVRSLLDQGLSPKECHQGSTPLHTAALQGHETIVKLLLEKGADVNVKDRDGRTALHMASSQGHDVVTRLLLEKGIDVGAEDKIGWTALDLAIQAVVMGFVKHDGQRRAGQVAESNQETEARTVRLLLNRWPDPRQICDTEMWGTISDATNTLIRYPPHHHVGMWESPVHDSEHSQSADVVIYKGSTTFKKPACINDITIYGGTAHFLEHSQIADPVIYGGSVHFWKHSQIASPVIYGGSVTFEETACIDDITIYGGSAHFLKHSQIAEVVIYGGSVTFKETACINGLTVYEGSAHFYGQSQIAEAEIYRGLTAFWKTVHMTNLVMWAGTVACLSDFHTRITEILKREVVESEGRASGRSSTDIEYAVSSSIHSGLFYRLNPDHTAVELATRSGHHAIARLLLEKETARNARTWPGNMCLTS